jgi:ketosteroid isomerase-like protein
VASREVELVRGAYDAWNRGDLEDLCDRYSEAAEARPFLGDMLGANVFRGHAGIRRWYAEANDPWDRLIAEPEEIIEAGARIVVRVHATGVGQDSGATVDARFYHVITVGEKIERVEACDDREDALRMAAAGAPASATAEPAGER